MHRAWKIAAGLTVLVLFVFANNTSRVSNPRTGSPTVVAHRGVSQSYQDRDIGAGGCEAARMVPPAHDFIENTIRSIKAAFDQGANVVEFDVQRTRDQQWAVFHDRRLECRTNGTGSVGEHTLEELQALDIAYGYTADGGGTYPFRGQGVGEMPSMDEVFETFPDGSFLIDIKTNSPDDGVMLARRLRQLPAQRRLRLMVFGREAVLAGFREDLPEVPASSLTSIQACLVSYIAYGWTGVVPSSCWNAPIYVPINVAPFLWGWPYRFMDRLETAGSSIVVVGRFGEGAISPGLDTLEDLGRIPSDYNGGIWTNDVALVRGEIEKWAEP